MDKVGRNDPCPCGSGKKYKKCCGAQNKRKSINASVLPTSNISFNTAMPSGASLAGRVSHAAARMSAPSEIEKPASETEETESKEKE